MNPYRFRKVNTLVAILTGQDFLWLAIHRYADRPIGPKIVMIVD